MKDWMYNNIYIPLVDIRNRNNRKVYTLEIMKEQLKKLREE